MRGCTNDGHRESLCTGPFSSHLYGLAGFLEQGAEDAARRLAELFAACDAGLLDDLLVDPAPPKTTCLKTSCHLLAMSLRHRLEGLSAARFYKGDPDRYVRSNLLVQRILGIRRPTLGWPVYAFGAEALGQQMFYPPDQAPGSDPGLPALSLEHPEDIPYFDPGCEIAKLVREMLLGMADLGRIEPVAHLPAPYSLAAEVVGQQNLILALSQAPAAVRRFLSALVDRFLAPWCADLHRSVPSVWLELSDASGSPMFIGPRNFLDVSVAPVLGLRSNPEWGERVFVANYRGDTSRARRSGGARRSTGSAPAVASVGELMDAKRVCCPWFVTRLEADSIDIETYVEFCKLNGMRLYAGIGATRTDRNSIVDPDTHIPALLADVEVRASAVREVGAAVKNELSDIWPGDVYLEDTNAESDLKLVAKIADTVGRYTAVPPVQF